jgi:hypothetical protein
MKDIDKYPKRFQSLNSTDIAAMVKDAQIRLIYIAPAVTLEISRAIVDTYHLFKKLHNGFKVILDTDPEVYRLGYGDPKGLSFLQGNNIPMFREKGVRIGCLIIDFEAWLYAPTPHLLEADRLEGIPNAVKITLEEAMPLVDQILGNQHHQPEVGIEKIEVREVARIFKNLSENPPMRFDIARKVRVFASKLEYVETHLLNTQINRKTIKIPSHLFGGNIDEVAQQRLKSTWKLIGENSKLDSRWIQKKRDRILTKYTKSLGQSFGRVILIDQKKIFLEEMGVLKNEISDFGKTVEKTLTNELEKTQKDIFTLLGSRLVESPTPEIKREFPDLPTRPKDLELYIMDKVRMPHVEHLLGQMELVVQFKGVTIENIQAEPFQEALQKAFKYIEWDSLFSEDDAVLGEEGN